MRVASILGARPQFVKAAALSRAFTAAGIDERIIHTGQHYDHDMSQAFFDEFGLPTPWRNLGVGSASGPVQTGRMLVGIAESLVEAEPDVVVVPGDTNSTLAGALAAVQLGIPVAHVEAGLRSFRRDMPEERNRVVADHLAEVLYAPSEQARSWLAAEGLADRTVVVGDVMRDVVEAAGRAIRTQGDPDGDPSNLVVATVHRPANTDDPARLGAIVTALEDLAGAGLHVVLPLHPRTRAALGASLPQGLDVRDPLPHGELLSLVAGARAVVTDSGGLQKEAYWLATPCITLRAETEWVETVEEGWNVLADADGRAITSAVERAAAGHGPREAYGLPGAADRIAADLQRRMTGAG